MWHKVHSLNDKHAIYVYNYINNHNLIILGLEFSKIDSSKFLSSVLFKQHFLSATGSN